MNQKASESDCQRIRDNWLRVRDEVAEACNAADRSADSVTIVGVTKYVGVEHTRALFDAGCINLGENRPQLMWEKQEALCDLPIQWHQIGHLQRNKAKRTIESGVHLVHSIDTVRLAKTISDAGESQGIRVDGLLEINVSGDSSKHGIQPDQTADALAEVIELPGLHLCGFMCMAAFDSDADTARADFAKMNQLRQAMTDRFPGTDIGQQISMGMSRDFRVAIAEGATIVRIGSSLYEGII